MASATGAWTEWMNTWSEAVGRTKTLLDAAAPVDPPEARWATPNRLVEVGPGVSLRLFGEEAPGRTPLLIVTPQVNHSYIADFSPTQSLARTLQEAGIPLVGVTDWAAPPKGQPYSIADSIHEIEACLATIGGRAHLVGLCQGGWQAAMVAARRPQDVASLTVAAAPIDPHQGSTLLHAFTFGMPLAFFRGVVAAGGGVAPGSLIAQGFDPLKPFERISGAYADLYLNADDQGYVQRYRELRNWYRLNKDRPGDRYIEAGRDLFQGNKLARGEFVMDGERLDLGVITCPLHLLAGARDHITPAEQVWALEALAPDTASCRRHLVDAGHIGVFMSRKALTTVWQDIAADLVAQDAPAAPAGAAEAAPEVPPGGPTPKAARTRVRARSRRAAPHA